MNKKKATFLALIAVLISVSVPVTFAIFMAKKQSINAEKSRTLVYAKDVVHRTETMLDQFYSGVQILVNMHTPDSCSAESLAAMQNVDLSSSYIQAFGYVSDNHWICSSLGKHGTGVDLGIPNVITPRGSSLRYDVQFPFTPDRHFLVIENSNYAAIVHKDLTIDATTDIKEVSLGMFSKTGRYMIASRGYTKPEWVNKPLENGEAVFFDHGYLVVVTSSKRYGVGAIAAVPVKRLEQQTHAFAFKLVPIAVIAGILMSLAILHLAKQQLAMPALIRNALKKDEFSLVYQPVVDLNTNEWVGAEALIRWTRANGEMVRPDIFIQVAEDAGLIQLISERVIEIVRRDALELFRKRPNFHLGINLAAADLCSMRTVELLRRLSLDINARSNSLLVEITERGFINTETSKEVLRTIRACGISVAIDDFGTGYSSLSYLENLDIDYLKIDKSFVDTIGKEAATSHVVSHIIAIAKDLKLHMVAEGIESDYQAEFLRDNGVQYGQGWLFAQPMKIGELLSRL